MDSARVRHARFLKQRWGSAAYEAFRNGDPLGIVAMERVERELQELTVDSLRAVLVRRILGGKL